MRIRGQIQILLARVKATASTCAPFSTPLEKKGKKRQHRTKVGANGQVEAEIEQEDEDPTFRPDSPFPWSAAAVAASCCAFYYKFANVVAVGMLVPVVNGVFFVCLAIFAFYKLKAASESKPWKGAGGRVKDKRGRDGDIFAPSYKGTGGKGRRTHRNTYLFG